MTAVTRAKAVLEGLAGKTLTNAKMVKIVDNFIANYGGVNLEGAPGTNEEKAQFFIDRVLAQIKHELRQGAKNADAVQAATLAAVEAAVVDL